MAVADGEWEDSAGAAQSRGRRRT